MNKKILKSFLALGTAAVVAAPIAAVVSCNDKDGKEILEEEVKKIVDATSTKNKADLQTSISGAKAKGVVGTVISASEIGYTPPTFSDKKVTILAYEVVEAYDSTKGTIKVKVKLIWDEDPLVTTGKTITITASDATTTPAKTDQQLVNDAAKLFVNVTSTKNKAQLKAKVGTKTTNNPVTPQDFGYTKPTLVGGVLVDNIFVKTVYDDQTGVIEVEVTLKKGAITKKVSMTITAKAYTDQEAVDEMAKLFVAATSTKKKPALNTAVSSKNATDSVTDAELGYTTPTLTDGVTVDSIKIKTKTVTSTGVTVIEVTLKKGSVTKTVDVTITPAP